MSCFLGLLYVFEPMDPFKNSKTAHQHTSDKHTSKVMAWNKTLQSVKCPQVSHSAFNMLIAEGINEFWQQFVCCTGAEKRRPEGAADNLVEKASSRCRIIPSTFGTTRVLQRPHSLSQFGSCDLGDDLNNSLSKWTSSQKHSNSI